MERDRQPAVYIMANRRNGTLYVGVTSDLSKRVWQHREGSVEGFTARYGCKMLVWFELHEIMESAILREKQLKAGSRTKKAGADRSGQSGVVRPLSADHRLEAGLLHSARNDDYLVVRMVIASPAAARQ